MSHRMPARLFEVIALNEIKTTKTENKTVIDHQTNVRTQIKEERRLDDDQRPTNEREMNE